MNFIVYFYVSNEENENYAFNSRFFYRYFEYYGVNSDFNVKFIENILDINAT